MGREVSDKVKGIRREQRKNKVMKITRIVIYITYYTLSLFYNKGVRKVPTLSEGIGEKAGLKRFNHSEKNHKSGRSNKLEGFTCR